MAENTLRQEDADTYLCEKTGLRVRQDKPVCLKPEKACKYRLDCIIYALYEDDLYSKSQAESQTQHTVTFLPDHSCPKQLFRDRRIPVSKCRACGDNCRKAPFFGFQRPIGRTSAAMAVSDSRIVEMEDLILENPKTWPKPVQNARVCGQFGRDLSLFRTAVALYRDSC